MFALSDSILVAGIAHEVNAPLGIGNSASSYIADRTKEREKKISANEMRKSDLENYLEGIGESVASLEGNLTRAHDDLSGTIQGNSTPGQGTIMKLTFSPGVDGDRK